MSFQPAPATTLTIDGIDYRVCEHPSVPKLPYGLDGREATVFKIVAGDRTYALKVFKRSFRTPDVVDVGDRLRPLADVPGLDVAQRTVLVPQRHAAVLARHADLAYAVIMPWIDGPTWFDLMVTRAPFTARESHGYADRLASLLFALEERRFAHSDLSAANLVLAGHGAAAGREGVIQLVDVDQFYSPGMARPTTVVSGSPGYGMANQLDAIWSHERDRFAGAVLLVEMLTWSRAEVRGMAARESYFDPREMQKECPRFEVIQKSLATVWGQEVANLFSAAWFSPSLADCPTFADWRGALPAPAAAPSRKPVDGEAAVRSLMKVAEHHRARGDVRAALQVLEQAQMRVAPGSGLADEVARLQRELRAPIAVPASGSKASSGAVVRPAQPNKVDAWSSVAFLALACLVGVVLVVVIALVSQCGQH